MTYKAKQFLLAACIGVLGAVLTLPASAGSAEDAVAAAKAAQMQADKVGGEWRDTGKKIKKAENLLQQGKLEEAEKLAREAEIEAMLGYMQATSQTPDKLHI